MYHDDALLLDILVSARRGVTYARDLDWKSFEQDELRQDGIIRCLTIVGEAVNKLSPQARASRPSVPWGGIIGMRNILVHNYARVNLAIVWSTVQQSLPHLIAALEPLVPPESD